MRALVTSLTAPGHLELQDVAEPEPRAQEAVVAVKAFSLNRGEVRGLGEAPAGERRGWDVAGVVERAAADSSGPSAGARVVGLVTKGWAERVAIPTSMLAVLPGSVTFEAASTLPVAGMTALGTLRMGGIHNASRVLVTGAAGGVGRFAVQLAGRLGEQVTAVVGDPERTKGLRDIGADAISVGMPAEGQYDVVLESVGGQSLADALRLVASGGSVVIYGCSSGEPTTFDARSFYSKHGARVLGFVLFGELQRSGGATHDLAHLLIEVAEGRLDPGIDSVRSWREAGAAAQALLDREVAGKAVLLVD